MPRRTEPQASDVSRALDEVLERAQLAHADRASGVELLGRVADLGAHPELPAIGEPGRGVDVHARRVDAELERPRRVGRPGDDRLGVTAAVRVDVLDRLGGRVDDPDRQLEREIFGVPILIGRRLDRHARRRRPRPRIAVERSRRPRAEPAAPPAGTCPRRRRGRAASQPRCTRRAAAAWRSRRSRARPRGRRSRRRTHDSCPTPRR